jgi:hypothetical protein
VQSLLLGRKHVPHKPVPGFLLDQKAINVDAKRFFSSTASASECR